MSDTRAPAEDAPCELYRDHGSARPCRTQSHHRFPLYLQKRLWGEIRLQDRIAVCGTCHDNIHAYLDWLLGEAYEPRPHPPARAKTEAQRVLAWFVNAQAATP